jgi:hypothetical protein
MRDYESHCIIDTIKINIYYLSEALTVADTLTFRQADGALQGSFAGSISRKGSLIKKLKNAAIKKCVRHSEQMRETNSAAVVVLAESSF